MINKSIFKLGAEDRAKAIDNLMKSSYPGSYFFVMLVTASIIATAGLALNNVAIIIGSMLVAPFLSPILSLGLGIVMDDFNLIKRSSIIVAKSAATAIIVSAIIAMFLNVPKEYNEEILSRVYPSLAYLYVAISAGIAASFAITKAKSIDFLAGIAITVAILPPLSTVGIGIATLNKAATIGAFQLSLVNLIGIIFSSIVIFSLMGFYRSRSKAKEAIKTEKKNLEKEEKGAKPKI